MKMSTSSGGTASSSPAAASTLLSTASTVSHSAASPLLHHAPITNDFFASLPQILAAAAANGGLKPRCGAGKQRVDTGETRHTAAYNGSKAEEDSGDENGICADIDATDDRASPILPTAFFDAIAKLQEQNIEEIEEENEEQTVDGKGAKDADLPVLQNEQKASVSPYVSQSTTPVATPSSSSRRKCFNPTRRHGIATEYTDAELLKTASKSPADTEPEDDDDASPAVRLIRDEISGGEMEEEEEDLVKVEATSGENDAARQMESNDQRREQRRDKNANSSDVMAVSRSGGAFPFGSPIDATNWFPGSGAGGHWPLFGAAVNNGTGAASAAQSQQLKWQQEYMDAQRRLYTSLFNARQPPPPQFVPPPQQVPPSTTHQKPPPPPIEAFAANERGRAAIAQLQQTQQMDIQRNYARLAQTLKDELLGHLTGTIDKVIGDFSATDQHNNTARMFAALSMAFKQQQQQMAEFQQQQQRQQASASSAAPPKNGCFVDFPPTAPHSTASLLNAAGGGGRMLAPPYASIFSQNPFFAAAAAAAAAMNGGGHSQQQQQSMAGSGPSTSGNGGSGIFPPNFGSSYSDTPQCLFPPNPHNSNPFASHDENGTPKKKRAKVTDSVRGPRSGVHRDSSASLPASGRSSPQPVVGLGNGGAGYFPPTMVPSLQQHAAFFRGAESPRANNSADDQSSDYGGTNGNPTPLDGTGIQQRTALTHVHLRKAKLMFFYTRYPSSAVLKSYFPDVHFNKNNTAQLVKWFSNFREFFYMQVEKYARQSIAEGLRSSDDIHVSTESDIYKQLNQHYNRNNVVQPPERLVSVIEETLKEFFMAIMHNKNNEPSWKKAIYKVIQQLDEPIPEYFKDPHFIEALEQS